MYNYLNNIDNIIKVGNFIVTDWQANRSDSTKNIK